MVRINSICITLEEFLNLPESKPSLEFIDGEVIRKPMPQGKHSTIQAELITVINSVTKSHKIARAFPELRCTFGGRSIVLDVGIFRWERIPRDDEGYIMNSFKIYPDWTIEILSLGQNQLRVTSNILHCLNYGATLGCLMDPESFSVLVLPPGQQPIILEKAEAVLLFPEFITGLEIKVGDLFECLKF